VYVRDLRRRPDTSMDADSSRLARPWRCEYRDAAGVRHGQRFGTRAEAEAWGADKEAEVASRAQPDPRQPFGPYAQRWRCREPRVHAERARYSVILKAEPIGLFSRRTIRPKSKLNGVACEKGYKNNRGCSEGQQCRRQETVAEQ
jgi:hypothetical protein